MALPAPQTIPENDIIREIKNVVDHNAGLLISDGVATDDGFSLETSSGETLEVDLSEKFVTRPEFEEFTGTNPATEGESGILPIATEAEAKLGQNDTKAMTPLKVLLQLVQIGLVKVDEAGNASINIEHPVFTLNDVLAEGSITEIVAKFMGGLVAKLTRLAEAGPDANAVMVGMSSDHTIVQLDQVPVLSAVTGILGVNRLNGADVGGQTTLEVLAEKLKPLILSTTPIGAPQVLNPIPDQTITASGDQTYPIPANTFSGTNVLTARKEDGSTLPVYLTGNILTIPGPVANQVLRVKIVATNSAGLSNNTVFTLTIARTVTDLPYFRKIKEIYIAGLKTLNILADTSYTGSTLSQLPFIRYKRADEANWRSDWANTFSTAGQWAPEVIADGYTQYWFGALQEGSETVTNVVVQLKPYASAPESTWQTFNLTLGSVDITQLLYVYGTSGKITFVAVKRIAGPEQYLAVYVDGTGNSMNSNLIATGDTPTYANGNRAMTSADGPYPSPGLFEGSVKFGQLYAGVLNKSYLLVITDEDGHPLSFPISLTDSTPVAILKDYDESGNPEPPDDGNNVTGETVVQSSNRSLLVIAVQESGGKYRVAHTNAPSGDKLYLLSGQPSDIGSLPTTYDYEPGDEVEITFIQGKTTADMFYDWAPTVPRAQAIIRFGQPT
ncbi:hypothetical protein GCM10028805_22430 [Spirosoma harenae]